MKKIFLVLMIVTCYSCHSKETEELIKSFTQFSNYSKEIMIYDFQDLEAARIIDSVKAYRYFKRGEFFFENCLMFDKLIYVSNSDTLKSKFDNDKIIKAYHSINDTLQKFASYSKMFRFKVNESNYSIDGNKEKQDLTVLRMRSDIMINSGRIINLLLSSMTSSCGPWGHETKTEGYFVGDNYYLSLKDSYIQENGKRGVSIKSILFNGKVLSYSPKVKSSDEYAKIIFPKLEKGQYEIIGEVAAGIYRNRISPIDLTFEVKD